MVVARAFDSKLIQMLHDFADWLNVRDYDAATDEATDRIVKKQSRGSIFAQNGWYMTEVELRKQSRRADSAMDDLRARLAKGSAARRGYTDGPR